MKQNNKNSNNNRFGNNRFEKFSVCSCGARSRLKAHKNYPHGSKSKPITSRFYQCEKCGETRFVIDKQKGGRR